MKARILPAEVVRRITPLLQPAFRPSGVVACLGLIGAALWLMVEPFRFHQMFELGFEADDFWIGYGLLLLSILFHELGHAAACSRFGVAPSDIGFSVYLIFPVFYSDVTAAWELSRWRRVVVDLSGVYFQLTLGALCLVIYRLSHWEPLWIAWLMCLGSAAFILNPVLRFDGYWIVADALGVTNLRQQPGRLIRRWWARLQGRPAPASPWPARVLVALSVYSVLFFSFWAFFLTKFMPLLSARLLAYPEAVKSLVVALLAGGPQWKLEMQPFLLSTYLALVAGFLLWRFGRILIRNVVGWLHPRTAEAP